jgi:hypothetical protein
MGISVNYALWLSLNEAFFEMHASLARLLGKSPAFTAGAVCMLALVIGTHAMIFSVLNALVPHSLKVTWEQSLYELCSDSQ